MSASAEFYVGRGKTIPWTEVPNPMGLAYADVELVPQMTTVPTRKDVNLSMSLGPYTLELPIIAAPMDTVSGEQMIRKLAKLGAIGTLPRAEGTNFQKNLQLCSQFTAEEIPCIYTVGLKDGLSQAQQLYEKGARVLLVDVANGGMKEVLRLAKLLKSSLKEVTLIAGNIATYDQAISYKESGLIDIARVGIGGGGACTTRLVAGTGVPQFSAVLDTVASGMRIIADGGIMEPGDAAKALGGGADFVMIGSMLAGTDEAPGETVNGRKAFRGQASQAYMDDHEVYGRTPEGISTTVPSKGPVEKIIKAMSDGIRSGMSYSNSRTVAQFHERALFLVQTAAARHESKPHAANI